MPDSAAPAPARGVQQAQRKKSQRCAPAEIPGRIAIKGGGVACRLLRGSVALGAEGATASLTLPAHRPPITPEAVAVAQDLTAQHRRTGY